MKFLKFFKRKYPYAPIAFLGRKNVEKMLGANIKKLKNIDKIKHENELDQKDAKSKQKNPSVNTENSN